MRDFAGTVRESADIVRVVSDYGVTLKGSGAALKALCPFHSEKTPSFSVHRDRRLFHCFGCGVGGDVFEFVMLTERVPFPEALKIVAEKCGIPIPSNPGSFGEDKKAEERRQLLELYTQAAAHFRDMLNEPEGAPARQALAKRQVNATSVERFQLGYAPASGLAQTVRTKLDPVSTGLFQKNDRGEIFDRFRRRLMFPIWDERGKTIAFGGRALGDQEPKYLNSPESPLYSKSHVLYAMHMARDAARRSGRLVMVEGYFDCLTLHQYGVENVVASCGTSLTPHQVALAARYVPEVVMNYDPDTAGQNAMRRSIDLLLEKGLRVRVLRLPGSLDPDEFMRKEGAEVYQRLLDGAPYFWQYLMTDAANRFDLEEPSLKAAAVKDVMEHVARIQDRVEQLEVAKAIAQGFKLPEGLVLERLNLKGRARDLAPVRRPGAPQMTRRLPSAERQLIQALGQDASLCEALRPLAEDEFWKDAWSWPVIERLILDPHSLEETLRGLEDAELRKQVREAVLEPVGPLTMEHARASIQKLYDAHLVKKEKEIRERLQQYGTEAAPAELLEQHRDIMRERSRMVEALRPRA
ncbi:MAG TPA: DNA primase [Terriglobia bacterium]|nr:DNA primase [Terriglobia bacterium]